MPFLIDGHNLIGTWPGRRVGRREDESEMRRLVSAFLRARRTSGTLVFDGAPAEDLPGDDVALGPLRVVYAGAGAGAADRRILRHLEAIARPREWTVVTSDRALGQAARTRGARWVSCASFRREMEARLADRGGEDESPTLDATELAEWLKLFGADEGAGDRDD